MIVTLAVVGVRFGFRGLRQYFAANRDGGDRVLLYGAGDAGVLTLRELRRNPALDRVPVGFIDDDPMKQNQTIQGIDVKGTGDDLLHVCRDLDVDEVIVTSSTVPETRKRAIYKACKDIDIPCTTCNVTLRPLQPDSSVIVMDDAELRVR
jgi:UDP-GlcNAc:undecaprenyl-phosphate GlcNAc-1-phosphate transferase